MSDTLNDLWEELDRGRFVQCSLRSDYEQVDGLQEGETVYIDPRPAILEILLHEMLHRKHPRWGEKKVLRESRRLVLSMDEATKATWWRAYQRVIRKGRPVDVDE